MSGCALKFILTIATVAWFAAPVVAIVEIERERERERERDNNCFVNTVHAPSLTFSVRQQ
jgi:hypothetical protein